MFITSLRRRIYSDGQTYEMAFLSHNKYKYEWKYNGGDIYHNDIAFCRMTASESVREKKPINWNKKRTAAQKSFSLFFRKNRMIINNKYQFNHHIYNTLHNRDFSVGYVIQVINNLCVIIGNNAWSIKRWFIRWFNSSQKYVFFSF